MGERSAVHVFEFATDRYAVRYAAGLDAAARCEIAEEVSGGFALDSWVGSENDLAHYSFN